MVSVSLALHAVVECARGRRRASEKWIESRERERERERTDDRERREIVGSFVVVCLGGGELVGWLRRRRVILRCPVPCGGALLLARMGIRAAVG